MLIITNKASVVSSALPFFFFFVLCLNQYLEKQRHSLPEPGAILERHSENEKEIHSPGWSQFPICFITVASGRVVKQGLFFCWLYILYFGGIYFFILFFFLLCNILLVLAYIDMNLPWVYMCSPSYPSGTSQCTSPENPVSCIEPGLVIHFTYDNLHVSMPFSHIIPLSLSPRVQRLSYTSVSLLLSHIQGYRYHLSKFHIYALVYYIGVFLSGLLHFV